ncbi:Hypothetical predicted protein [Mytilus galloprovincialis]|uniref:Ig-like domain-containing protein n=1 Tax=Mytilus galloprovincialis TaxID=29158 RepID=A0A8B6CZL0_MYTGA|nr:Hypothetical predicted protein [Mytilus galloprovincialis]
MAFNKSSTTFEPIATYIQDKTPLLNTQGQYLKGRVTLTPITQSSAKAVMTFDKLMCIDDTFYQCSAYYLDTSGHSVLYSNNISISVQVPPTKPDSISIVHKPTDPFINPAKHMEYSTSTPSSSLTSKENEMFSALQTVKQNNTNKYSRIKTVDYATISFQPSDGDFSSDTRYRTTTTTQDIAEGDNITVVCTGDVGKPPVEHVFQKHLNGQIVAMQDTVTTTSISEMSENCSYYRTSNIVFKVTAFDNNAVIRCVVHSSMADPDMYIDTEPLEVYYEVSEPTITKYPNKPFYVVGENTSILLTCKSDGNPQPYYKWYKENDNLLISTNESWIITDMNVTNSGIYTCNVSNTFNGDTHSNAKHVQVNIMNKDIAPSTTFRTSVSNKTSVIKQSNNENTAVIVVGTVCGLIILVICVILFGVLRNKNKTFRCLLRRNHPDRSVDYVNTIHQQDPSLYEGVGQASDEHNYEPLSRMEHVYNNTNLSNN